MGDFSDSDNWLIYSKEGTDPEWFLTDNDEIADIAPYLGEMESTTADNGFAAFDGIQYLLDDIIGVPEEDAYLEYAFPINCAGIDGVILEFEQRCWAFNLDQTFLEVTATTWEEGEYISFEINAFEPTNGASVQSKELLDISEIAAGKSSVKICFRWLETSLADGTGSGYVWFIDDLLVREAWEVDQAISASYHRSGIGVFMGNGMEYYMIPPFSNYGYPVYWRNAKHGQFGSNKGKGKCGRSWRSRIF
tara:strand:+ start:541 stop:1287 length:747 start_codon:yes stop_codon:yes gene_type:complete